MPARYRKVKIDGRTYSAHRVIWEKAHGPIPAGHIIHHRDGNRFHNDLSNLELLTHQAHSAHHNQKHSLTATCKVCGVTFTPAPTKRARAQTCSKPCFCELMRRQKLGAA